MDRERARRDPRALSDAVRAVRAFFDGIGAQLPLFDPFATDQPQSVPDSITKDVRAALADRDWIEGYRAGRDDVKREAEGLTPRGPGATADAKDGWSPTSRRVEAYALGRVDGERAMPDERPDAN